MLILSPFIFLVISQFLFETLSYKFNNCSKYCFNYFKYYNQFCTLIYLSWLFLFIYDKTIKKVKIKIDQTF
jgi:hypothetical protein